MVLGEIVGRLRKEEERLDVLKEKIKDLGYREKELWWYLDLKEIRLLRSCGLFWTWD